MKPKLAFLLFLLLTSCSSSKIIELGGKTSVKGAEVSQKALDVYSVLSNQAAIDKSQQDKLKVLTNPSPATMPLPNTKAKDFSNQLSPRIQAYKSLMAVYAAFALLTDSKYADKTEQAVSALQDSYNAISKLPDLPDVVKSKLPGVAKLITGSIQAKKIRAHNEILYALSQAYLSLWKADTSTWEEYIDLIYNSYADGLNTVDSKRYDASKIAQDIKEPYKDEATIILMYRLRNRDEIMKQKNDTRKQLNDLGKALEELTLAHAEIAKEKPDLSTIISSLNRIEELLKTK
jgi:hypothetical protein